MSFKRQLIFLVLGFIAAFFLHKTFLFHELIIWISSLGVFGIFSTGFLFSSSLTAGTSLVALLDLTNIYSPIKLALIAALGGLVCDLCVLYILKKSVPKKFNHSLPKFLKSKRYKWLMPILGAIIIASPLPDELGVSLLGISKISNFKFALLSYSLNVVGIFLVVGLGSVGL